MQKKSVKCCLSAQERIELSLEYIKKIVEAIQYDQ